MVNLVAQFLENVHHHLAGLRLELAIVFGIVSADVLFQPVDREILVVHKLIVLGAGAAPLCGKFHKSTFGVDKVLVQQNLSEGGS